ncbi:MULTISPECIES: transposase [unclassified Mesorhizobium]|uniref:transposase n=1 Tax=unclassified Mesorhizobium TaxID=325217 RepID=UPI001CCFEED0|nr:MULTISPECIES: transposase [unclassified Mesorhizobium]MBZ9983425.1 transposase [Mesorhizobium sp. BR-1-1-8]
MVTYRTHSIEFKRQVVQEFLSGETLHGLAKRHELPRNLIRIWVQKYEAGSFDEDVAAADTMQTYEARIAALERLVGRQALEIEFLKGALKSAPRPRSGTTSGSKFLPPPTPLLPIEPRRQGKEAIVRREQAATPIRRSRIPIRRVPRKAAQVRRITPYCLKVDDWPGHDVQPFRRFAKQSQPERQRLLARQVKHLPGRPHLATIVLCDNTAGPSDRGDDAEKATVHRQKRHERKERISDVARESIEVERAARDAKTARLREQGLMTEIRSSAPKKVQPR